ncbi:MAG TPA: response regulator [Rhodanobacteraceae bacterium]|nr:response regulator [Rhodanobacteraceae bacterium]
MSSNGNPPCVLLAEDEMFVAMMLEDRLQDAGYRVLKAARLAKCLELAESEPIDVAVLDINLAGEASFPVATALRERGIPFVFSSGYGDEGIPDAWRGEPVIQKPYDTKELLSALDQCRGGGDTGNA